jgi:YD repeat-containing protein
MLRAVLVTVTLVIWLVILFFYAGPIMSGALFLTWHGRFHPQSHDLPSSFVPLHSGRVDVRTGAYIREDDDILLGGTPPFVLRRTSRSNDRTLGEFGIGSTHNGELRISGDGARFQWCSITLPDGREIRYDRVTPGTSYWMAKFEHWETPTEFYGSQLGWNGREWVVREQDSTIGKFFSCAQPGSKCAMFEWRDADGHYTHFVRDDNRRLTSVDTGSRRITFTYDPNGRILAISDQAGQTIVYAYDDYGRLQTASNMNGTLRTYYYDAWHRLVQVDEPGHIVDIVYDRFGRCVRYRTRSTGAPRSENGETYEVKYAATESHVSAAVVTQTGAAPVRYAFNDNGDLESETYNPDTDAAVVVRYTRDAVTNHVTGVTVTCPSARRERMTRSLPSSARDQEDVKARLLAGCGQAR